MLQQKDGTVEAEVGMTALKIEEGATCQGTLLEAGKQETDSPLKAPEGIKSCNQLDLGSLKLISNIWPLEL